MKWNRFTLKTKTDAEDMVICTLAEVGIEGVEIQDKKPLTEEDKAQMFVDIMPEGPADDGIAYLNFYLEEDADKEAILKDVRAALDELKSYMDIGEATIEESQTEDKDWINNWKQYFHQFYVDDILIVPSWEEVKAEDQDKMILHIDPGTAFGTGMHETTQLVIRQLKKYVTYCDSQYPGRCTDSADTSHRAPDEEGSILYYFRYSGCKGRGSCGSCKSSRTDSSRGYSSG